jgi:hypothetical protein
MRLQVIRNIGWPRSDLYGILMLSRYTLHVAIQAATMATGIRTAQIDLR